MIVESISLRHFRNYTNINCTFDKGLNVITGDNAQGKTNLLESLVYLSLTRSHRINQDKKLIQDNALFANIQCKLIDGSIHREIQAIIHEKGKTLMIQHQPVQKSSDFVGLLNVIFFSPDDLSIFNDSPKERRKIINQEITKVSKKYLYALNQFNASLKERNQLLKKYPVNMKLLDTLDELMARNEVVIMKYRKQYIDMIDSYITSLYRSLSNDQVEVHLKYQCCIEGEITFENVLHAHQFYRNKDLDMHSTTFGIHREDMIFEMNKKNIVEIASQGQKRMTVLAFKMAELQYIENKIGKKPVLLLDDVLSELDEIRQKRLMHMIGNTYQCIITTTHIPQFLMNRKMKIFQIQNGNIVSIKGGNV